MGHGCVGFKASPFAILINSFRTPLAPDRRA